MTSLFIVAKIFAAVIFIIIFITITVIIYDITNSNVKKKDNYLQMPFI